MNEHKISSVSAFFSTPNDIQLELQFIGRFHDDHGFTNHFKTLFIYEIMG